MKRLAAVLAFLTFLAWTTSSASAGDDVPAAPTKVVVGVYVDRLTEMSLRENHFHADFYVWFRWSGGDKDFDPLKSFDVANGSITQRQAETREEHKDFHYASVRCEAEITQYFDVSRFPFDDHVLEIQIEDTEKEAEFVEYVADVDNSCVAEGLQAPGWTIEKPSAKVVAHHYATNYGNIDLPAGDKGSYYSQYVFSIPLVRRGAGYFLKIFFGLFIAVCIALLAFHIKPTDLDPRFGLPVGAIFAAVGSLYVTSQILPDTNLITLSDRLHILAFATILLTLIVSAWSLHVWTSGDEARAKRIDKTAFRALVAFYVVASIVAVFVS
jgi:hypothetical protein